MRPVDGKAQVNRKKTSRRFTYDHKEMLSLDIAFPEVRMNHNALAQTRINLRIRRETRQFESFVKNTMVKDAIDEYRNSQKNGYPFRPYGAAMDYTITLNQGCTLSLYYDQYTYTGGAHGSTVRLSDTWSLKTGRIIRLEDLFPRGINWRRLIIEQILKQADANMKSNPGIYFHDYRTLIAKTFDPDSFFLTPNGLNIYYQQYDIAPYAVGIVVFEIPYANLGIRRPDCQ